MGKLIEGNVSASAGEAAVKVNAGEQFTVREATHYRIRFNPADGKEVGRETLIEAEVTSGTPPAGFLRFMGVGTLRAEIKVVPGQPPQIHTENYRFPVAGLTLEEAWANYEDWSERGAAAANADFRARYAEHQRQVAQQLVVPKPGGAGLVGPGGAPL